MGLSNIIRRRALREKQSIRAISRPTGLSRNTIANYFNPGTIEPTFTVPERSSKLDPFSRQTGGLAEDRGRKVAQAAPDLEAASCRAGDSRFYGLVQSGGRLRPQVASRSAT
ncbi:hypothetical protein Brsp05_04619 [Brucella sp. NBRC 12953]